MSKMAADLSQERSAEISEYTANNEDFLSRVLAHGGPEARGYVLAVLAHGASVEQIEQVEKELERIKRELAE
jgi:hypothetical protein